ncbi:uncharacterized protein LAESUDRAFT_690288 [Laetiporus sulphureus 93-53]|uniref:Uncharacterized protein n=1 Tax=Laetiporus sulphureus 93-53 TaxID=1314785 RepID=A0A165II53_9APHY|nr:uncharacterized protein LAESUDRAFT_690288 [Laetiporus sulphureus 93-53]KZT13107.1 hypothetical protein LAESUDRAFT_690288 [Laetiporus sulphureus 93-53]
MLPFDAILFPADERPPHLVALMTSPLTMAISNPPEPYRCGRIPHPEMYMEYIAEGLGPRSWRFQVVEQLEHMSRKFSTPYILFYPIVSRDGMPFPVNKCIREIQGQTFNEANAWCGNIIIAKYRDQSYSTMMHATMADFPILKNWLSKPKAVAGLM